MMPMHPQPAGLPSGSFGGRRSRAARAGARTAWLSAAHRPPLLLGAVLLALAAIGGGALLLARALHLALPMRVDADLAVSLPFVVGALPMLALSLSFGAGPQALGLGAVPARLLALPVRLAALGWAVAAVGFHLSRAMAGLGLALAAVGLGLAVGLHGLLVLEARSAGTAAGRRAGALSVVGGLVSAVALWAVAVAVVLGRDGLASSVLAAAAWAGPALMAVALGHALLAGMSAAADEPDPRRAAGVGRSRTLLTLVASVVLLQVPLAALPALIGSLPAPLAVAAAVVELPAGALLLWLSLRWGFRPQRRRALPAMVHLAWAWLGAAFTLGGVSHAVLVASGGVLSLGAAPQVALLQGFALTALLAMATWWARAEGGRRTDGDNWTAMVFWVLQVAVALRLVVALWPASGLPLALLAAQFWLAALLAWSLRHGRWCLRAAAGGARTAA